MTNSLLFVNIMEFKQRKITLFFNTVEPHYKEVGYNKTLL